MVKTEIKKQAIYLRKNGYSLSKISGILNISKSTCSIWLKNVVLDKRAKQLIHNTEISARAKAIQTRSERRKERDSLLFKNAEKIVNETPDRTGLNKIFCGLLYAAEGEKNSGRIAFTNSDPDLVRTFLILLRKSYTINEHKFYAMLHLHPYHDINKQQLFWAKVTGISKNKMYIFKKKKSKTARKVDYQGCISIRYCDVNIAKEIEFINKAMGTKYGRVG